MNQEQPWTWGLYNASKISRLVCDSEEEVEQLGWDKCWNKNDSE